MIIKKLQTDPLRSIFNWSFFLSARSGFRVVLEREKTNEKKILLPAYIGYSQREGSGVFDPIRETGIAYLFYRLTGNLQINLDDLTSKIKENPGSILLLIHYFGFKDEKLEEIKELARIHKLLIIEDFAHAFFTFWQDPRITFDYSIFSLHKLFPLKDGGALLSKKPWPYSTDISYDLFRYDFSDIARRRCENYLFILERLNAMASNDSPFTLIHDILDGAVPQTFPLLLPNEQLRDIIYFRMNEAGYGLVSLYHELIQEIDASFDTEHEVSRRIINLPLHQDVGTHEISQMLDLFLEIMNE